MHPFRDLLRKLWCSSREYAGWASLSRLIFIVGGQTFCVDDYLNDQNGPHTVMLNRHLGPTGHQRKYETHADRRKEINTCISLFFACGRVKEQFCAQQRVGNEVQRWGVGGTRGGDNGLFCSTNTRTEESVLLIPQCDFTIKRFNIHWVPELGLYLIQHLEREGDLWTQYLGFFAIPFSFLCHCHPFLSFPLFS